jgi:glycosyltransferase involved in cell wall biosynthesis
VRIVIDYRPALRERTGVGEFAHRLARALVREGAQAHRVTLFSSSWKDRLASGVVDGAEVIDRHVPVRLLNLLWHRAGWPAMERLAGDADVVQSLHPLLPPTRRAAAFLTIHDLDFLDHPERTAAEIRRDYAALVRSHAARADGILVPSAYTASRVTGRLEVPADRITVFPPFAPDWRPRAEPPAGGPILFLGTVEPRKNVPALIAAYERLVAVVPDAPPLVIAGRIPPGGEALLAARPAAAARIDRRGYVPDDERRRLFDQASMLVLPSLDEGFGLPVAEAMAVGVPVIVSTAGSLPELVGDAGLTVAPHDRDGLAAAMQHLLEDTALRRRLIDAGFARVRAFDPGAAARHVLRAYEEAVQRRRSRS